MKRLFIDETFFAATINVKLTMNPPAKTGQATIPPDRPWEELGVNIGSIVQVGKQ